jgi:hypothetical protein
MWHPPLAASTIPKAVQISSLFTFTFLRINGRAPPRKVPAQVLTAPPVGRRPARACRHIRSRPHSHSRNRSSIRRDIRRGIRRSRYRAWCRAARRSPAAGRVAEDHRATDIPKTCSRARPAARSLRALKSGASSYVSSPFETVEQTPVSAGISRIETIAADLPACPYPAKSLVRKTLH